MPTTMTVVADRCASGHAGNDGERRPDAIGRTVDKILGTLFERGLDPDKRAQLGAHYTDRDKIMLLVDPVVIRPLLAEWAVENAEIAAELEPRRGRRPAAGAGRVGGGARARGRVRMCPVRPAPKVAISGLFAGGRAEPARQRQRARYHANSTPRCRKSSRRRS